MIHERRIDLRPDAYYVEVWRDGEPKMLLVTGSAHELIAPTRDEHTRWKLLKGAAFASRIRRQEDTA